MFRGVSEHQIDAKGRTSFPVKLRDTLVGSYDDRLIVTLGVRLTLRTRTDRRFLAQGQAGCRQSALRHPRDGAPVVYACITQMGRDAASWLALVQP